MLAVCDASRAQRATFSRSGSTAAETLSALSMNSVIRRFWRRRIAIVWPVSRSAG
jgi:hypothetical protein